MAMSLLYALLGVNDPQTIEDLKTQYPQPPGVDVERALRYYGLPPKQKREVRAALYKALYTILEYSDVNRELSMAIGKALCNAVSGNSQGPLQNDPGIKRLQDVLKPVVTDAIDER